MYKIAFVIAVVIISAEGGLAMRGSGTQEDPWRIESLADFNEFAADANYWDDYARLETDVNLAGLTYPAAVIAPDPCNGQPWHEGIRFIGVFDGAGHCIKNLRIDASSTGNDFLGLIGMADRNSVIKDLGLEDFRLTGGTSYRSDRVGALAGCSLGRVENCYSTGYASANFQVGGLLGLNSGEVVNCYCIHSIVAASDGGGLVGYNGDSGRIANCWSTGTVEGGQGTFVFPCVGGLAGQNSGTIELCYSSSSVSPDWETDYLGGLVGYNYEGTIKNCCARGEVGGGGAGGLVGRNEDGQVRCCYSTGKALNGLVGRTYGGIAYSYWDIETSETDRSAGGTGLTTAEMMRRETYIFWEQEEACVLDEGNDYPRLIWEDTPGTPIVPVSGVYGGGDGTAENPFLIETRGYLLELHMHPADWDSHFRMISDIDLSPDLAGGVVFPKSVISYNTAPNYWHGFVGIAFSGSFDGGGHAISNLTIDPEGRSFSNLGLFGQTTDSSLIRDLVVDSVAITGYTGGDYVGAVAGDNRGTISSCRVSGSVVGYNYAGGLVGSNSGVVYDCSVSVDLKGMDYVGGVAGDNEGKIEDCQSTILIQGSGEVGGLVGRNDQETLGACCVAGSVSGVENVGGLVGQNIKGKIEQCFANCDI